LPQGKGLLLQQQAEFGFLLLGYLYKAEAKDLEWRKDVQGKGVLLEDIIDHPAGNAVEQEVFWMTGYEEVKSDLLTGPKIAINAFQAEASQAYVMHNTNLGPWPGGHGQEGIFGNMALYLSLVFGEPHLTPPKGVNRGCNVLQLL
jgi:hypothetical protein